MLKIQIITIEGDREDVTGLLHDFDPEEFRVKLADHKVNELTREFEELASKIYSSTPVPDLRMNSNKVGNKAKGNKFNPATDPFRPAAHTTKPEKEKPVAIMPSIPEKLKKDLEAAGDKMVKEARESGKKKIDWKKYKKPSNVIRDKNCLDCGTKFHDDTRSNMRKWCDTCTPNHYTPKGSLKVVKGSEKPEKESELIPVPEPARLPEETEVKQPEVATLVEVPEKKIKSCSNCGVSFEDTSSNGNRKKCDKCRFAIKTPKEKKAPGIEDKKTLPVFSKVEIESELEKRLHKEAEKEAVKKPKINLKEKIDLSENGPLLKPPANNRPPVILKQNERRCKNPRCKKIFVPVNILKDETCPECQERAKQVEAEGEW